MDALKKSEPSNTFLKVYWFPVLEASIDIAQHAPDRAVIALEPALPYELGNPPPEVCWHHASRLSSGAGLFGREEWAGCGCGISEDS